MRATHETSLYSLRVRDPFCVVILAAVAAKLVYVVISLPSSRPSSSTWLFLATFATRLVYVVICCRHRRQARLRDYYLLASRRSSTTWLFLAAFAAKFVYVVISCWLRGEARSR